MAIACLAGAAGAGAACAAAASPPVPTFAHTVVLRPISGKVLIDLPGAQSGFNVLRRARVVPVGTVVDTTGGRVSLTSANPSYAAIRFQSGQFFRGIFRVRQSATAGGLIELVMRDRLSRRLCTPPAAHAAAPAARAAALSQRVLGLLRGVAKGRFRTVGHFSAATVRGTNWGVRDRCDGTLTVVRRGVVAVRDFVHHRTVVVRAGGTYLAKAP
jgi:hypothetical protein